MVSWPSLLFSPCVQRQGRRGWASRVVDEGLPPTSAVGRLPAPLSPHPPRASLPPPETGSSQLQMRRRLSESRARGHRQMPAGSSAETLACRVSCLPSTEGPPSRRPEANHMLFSQERGAAKGKAWCLTNPWKWSSPPRLPWAPGASLEQSVRAQEAKAIPSAHHLPDVSQLRGRQWPMAERSGSRGSLLCCSCLGVTGTRAPSPEPPAGTPRGWQESSPPPAGPAPDLPINTWGAEFAEARRAV